MLYFHARSNIDFAFFLFYIMQEKREGIHVEYLEFLLMAFIFNFFTNKFPKFKVFYSYLSLFNDINFLYFSYTFFHSK